MSVSPQAGSTIRVIAKYTRKETGSFEGAKRQDSSAQSEQSVSVSAIQSINSEASQQSKNKAAPVCATTQADLSIYVRLKARFLATTIKPSPLK